MAEVIPSKYRDLFDKKHGKQDWPDIEEWGTAND